jgi:hypothetical protein
MKIGSKNSLCPHSHFIEHLVGAFKKSSWESNLNHESSSLNDLVTQERYREQPAAIKNHTQKKSILEHHHQGAPRQQRPNRTGLQSKPAGAGTKSAQEEHELTGGGSKVRAGKAPFRSGG